MSGSQPDSQLDNDSFLSKTYTYPAVLVVVLVILLVLIFNNQISYWINATKATVISTLSGNPPAAEYNNMIPDEDDFGYENLEDGSDNQNIADGMLPPGETSDTLTTLGHEGKQPWDEIIAATELDPSTFANHHEFVKDVRRFSSGANFTSVNDADTNSAFTNFVGLRRPEAVPIGPTARQQPDVDESVLMRNSPLRWNSGPRFDQFY